MRRISVGVLAGIATVAIVSGCGTTPTDTTTHDPSANNTDSAGQKIVVGVSGSLVPYLFQNDQNKWVGVNEELLQSIFSKQRGYTLEYKEMSFENLIPALSSKRVDVTTNIYDTPERRAKLDFLDFYSSPFAVFTLKKNSAGIHSWSDLCGKTLASIYASTIGDAVKKANQKYCPDNPVKNQQQSGSYADLARQVDNGRVFGAIDDAGIWGYFVKRNSKYALALDKVGKDWHWALAFPKGSPLRKKVRPLLDDYLHSNKPQASAKKWGIDPSGFSQATSS